MTSPKTDPKPGLVLVDSSVYITLHRQRLDPFAELKRFDLDYDFAINGIIWAEVLRGRSDPFVRDRYQRAFSVTQFLSLSAAGWNRVAQLAWELDRRGNVLPLTDVVIAVTAIEHSAAVFSFDRHFQKIPGLVTLTDLS
jgi:predicted nucleic acid-binding protein